METIGLTHTYVSIYFFRSLHLTSISVGISTSEMGKTNYTWKAKPRAEPHCQHTNVYANTQGAPNQFGELEEEFPGSSTQSCGFLWNK